MTALVSAFSRHLVESTLFAAFAIALAGLFHRRGAATRHALLLAAVAKFLLPLAPFVGLGTGLRALLPIPAVTLWPTQALPMPASAPISPSHTTATPIAALLFCVWLTAALFLLVVWIRHLLQPSHSQPNRDRDDLATLDRMRHRVGLRRAVSLRISVPTAAPHLAGIVRPAILLPAELSRQLTQPEFEAVLLHELGHAKRRDNLSRAFVHVVTCVFWFHPLLWWLERRIAAESELACDDLVLSSGVPSDVYLHGICKVCELSLGNPVAGNSHLSGPNLKHRLERIMSVANNRPTSTTHAALAGALLLTGTLALAIAAGLVTSTPVQAQTPDATAHAGAPHNCVYASEPFPQGTVIRLKQHPALLSVCGQEDGRPKWSRTTEADVSSRNTPVITVDDTPSPQSLACNVTEPDGKFCTCDHLRFSPGSVVGSPSGKLACPVSGGKWQPFKGLRTPWPPLPTAN